MNFFRKLFGSKPSTPPAKSIPATTPATPADSSPPPESASSLAASTPVAPAPSPRVTWEAVTPSIVSPIPPPNPTPVKIETTLLTIDGPVWLPGDSPAIELCPVKPDDAPAIAFLGGSAELLPPDRSGRAPLAEVASRLSRALPLYLAEQIEFRTEALTRTHVSWLVKPAPGFILGGQNWDDATAARHVRAASPDDPADYVVILHLVCTAEPWSIELRLVRTIDGSCLGTATARCPSSDPAQALPGLTRDLLDLLATHAEVPASAAPDDLLPVPGSAYLLRLEQLLAVRTAALPGAAGTVRGEGEILEGQLQLCLDQPASVPVRLLFAHTLRALKAVRPAALADYRIRVEQLEKDHPLAEPAQSVVARVCAEAFAS